MHMTFGNDLLARRKARVAHSWSSSLALAGFVLLSGIAAPPLHAQGATADESAGAASSTGAVTAHDPASAAPTGTVKAKGKAAPQRRSRASRRRAPRSSRRVAVVPAIRSTAPRSADALATDLGTMVDGSTRSGHWGVMVVSLTRGDTLYSVNPGEQVLPASTFKLFTSALALERLGPNYQLTTDVLRDGAVGPDGTLSGNLIIRGDGDPGFSSRWVRGTPSAPMDQLAHQVAAAGIRHVKGDVVGDATGFDDQKIPEGWLTRYLGAGYAARVSALSINENLVAVVATPGSGRGPANVAFEPATTTLQLQNNVKTVPGSSGGRVRVVRRSDGIVVASGWIGSRSAPRGYQLVVDDPALFTVGAFRAALQKAGITVDGQTRLGQTPANAARVTLMQSPPLSWLISVMNRESINHYAELLFRDATRGPKRERVASVAAGDSVLGQFLQEKVGVTPDAVHAADGSGLSTLDRITPRAMIKLLAYAHRAPWGTAFHASLPVAGESELLRHRMRYTAAAGNLHAKTGTTNEVIGLAGYVTALDGEVLAFAFIYNGHDRWNAKSTMDTMGATMAAFVRP